MPSYPSPAGAVFPGDRARRRSVFCLGLALLATPAAVWLFLNLKPLLRHIVPLEGGAFVISATALGIVLALLPVAAVFGWLLALWFSVESVYSPRQRATPIIDRFIVGTGILAWFLPALAFLASAVYALFSGRVHFVQPARDYLRSADPIAYWQGVGFMFIIGGIFVWAAWRYWQGKLRRSPDSA
jgi:hypothetical protein